MAVVIDSLEKLRVADDVLKSGRGTPDERAAIQMAMEEALPAIKFAQEFSTTGSFRSGEYGKLSDNNQVIVNQFLKQQGKRSDAKWQADAIGVAGGMGRGAYEILTSTADALGDIPLAGTLLRKMGTEDLSQWSQEKAKALTDATYNVSLDVLQEGFGRAFSEEEKQAHRANIEGRMQAGELIEKTAAAISPTKFIGMGKAKGLISGVALGAAEGAVTGALTADIDQDMTEEERASQRASGATLGAIIGAPVGAITGAYASVRNLIAGNVQKAVNEPATKQMFDIAEEFDIPITLGQASGNPSILATEANAGSKYAAAFLAEQGEALAPSIANRLNVVIPELKNIGKNITGRVGAAFRVLDDTVSDMKFIRQKAWTKAGKKAIEVSGDAPIMPVNQLQGRMQNIMEQIDNRFGGAAEMGTSFKRLFTEVQKAARNGGATAQEVSDWWLRINTMAEAAGTSGFVKASKLGEEIAGPQLDVLAGALQRTMRESIEAAPKSAGMNLLRAQRGKWSEMSKSISNLNQGVMEVIGLNGKVTPDGVRRALDVLDVDEMQAAMAYIRKQKGGRLKIREIQGALVEDAAHQGLRAGADTPGMSGAMDVKTFLDALSDTTYRSRLAGVLDETQEATAVKGIELMRGILNEQAAASNRVLHRVIVGAENVAINLVSRDPGFLARLTAGAIVRGKGADWLFYSKEGLEVLKSLHPQYMKWGKTAAARQAAITLVTSMLADGAKETVSDKQEMGQQQ